MLVHWNQPDRCLRTLQAFEAQPVPVGLLVVDNDSRPGALARLRKERPDVEILELARNAGFGPAANAGLRRWLERGEGEWAVVAPHDALPAIDCLERLLDELEVRPAAGLACADVGDGQSPVVDPYFGGMTVPARTTEGWEPVDYPHGTLLAARRACLVDIGLFDERYFSYCEEADLGLRARASGWEVGLVRGAMVRNPAMSSGSPAVDYLMHRNTLLLVREHSGSYHAFIRFVIALLQLAGGLVRPANRPLLFSARGRVWGLIDHLRARYGPPPEALLTHSSPG